MPTWPRAPAGGAAAPPPPAPPAPAPTPPPRSAAPPPPGPPAGDPAPPRATGARHFRAVGAGEVVGAPDARTQPDEAAEVIRSARLLVLPGGSPSRLLAALQTTPVGELVAALL